LILPEEEYDWFDILKLEGAKSVRRPPRHTTFESGSDGNHSHVSESAHSIRVPAIVENGSKLDGDQEADSTDSAQDKATQKNFYEHAGPLYSARISPTTCTMSVGSVKNFQAIARDRNRRTVIDDLEYHWVLSEGNAEFDSESRAIVSLKAPPEPQLLRLTLTVTQIDRRIERKHAVKGDMADQPQSTVVDPDSQSVRTAQAEAIITVTDSLLPKPAQANHQRGMPKYTFEKQPGQLWRSRFATEANLIVINSGHRDFIYASRNKSLKLRYICRLFGKELILQNFPGMSSEQLLERLIELALYTEENLR